MEDNTKKSMEKVTKHLSRTEGEVVQISETGEGAAAMAVGLAIDAIGMGRYQWQLMFTCGFGFVVDQMLLVSISIVTPQAALEFRPKYQTLLSSSQYAGLLAGAIVCGLCADRIGRRLIWLLSLFGLGVFTTICASAPNWAALNIFVALCGFCGGGNLAIDLTVLAECLPRKWAFLLTGLACLWGLGNSITGLIAWPLMVHFACPSTSSAASCSKADNMGWRYLYLILGGLCILMSIVRTIVMKMHESPKWLLTRGKVDEAVAAINYISKKNGADYVLSRADLPELGENQKQGETLASFQRFFKGRKLIRSTVCLILLWIMIGIAYPIYIIFLPYYLQSHGARLGDGSTYQTYRDWTISSVVGIFGPVLSAYFVEVPRLGRRGGLVITACFCAVFAGAFTSVKNEAQNIAFSCMINFWLNALYGIIYGYTPEVLPTESRGTGCGLLMAFGRVASLTTPFIATFADVTTSAPIWVACGLFVAIGLVSTLLPFEPRHRDITTHMSGAKE